VSQNPGGRRLSGPPTLARHQLRSIPAGDSGIAVTIAHMAQLARAAQTDLLVLRTAQRLAGSTTSYAGQIAAIRAFLRGYVRFVRDPLEVETLKAPREMLLEVARSGETWGDCDDIATLGAALGMSVGFPARFVVLSFGEAVDGHVYAELLEPDSHTWLELDTSKELQGLPEIPEAQRTTVFTL